jgi:hypothetical protein
VGVGEINVAPVMILPTSSLEITHCIDSASGTKNYQKKSRSHLKIIGARTITKRKFYMEIVQVSGVTVQT